MHTLEEMCNCAAGEARRCLQSEKFRVDLHWFCVVFTQFTHDFDCSNPHCDSTMGFCLAKCSYAQNMSEEDTFVPVSSNPSFLLTYFSIPIPLAYLGLGRAGESCGAEFEMKLSALHF